MKYLFLTLSLLTLLLGICVSVGILSDYGADWRAAALAAILLGCCGGSSWVLLGCAEHER